MHEKPRTGWAVAGFLTLRELCQSRVFQSFWLM